jgi:hypothetical protein
VRRLRNALWAIAALAAVCVPAAAGRGADQTIPDAALGVTWLADANLPASQPFGVSGINPDGSMDFQAAVDWVHALDKDDYLGHRNWMLPTTPVSQPGCQSHNGHGAFGFGCTVSPLPALYSTTFHLAAPDTAVSVADGDVGPFHDFQPYLYWTSSVGSKASAGYRTFSFNTGWAGSNVPKHDMYALPLVPGNPFDISGSGNGLFPGDGGAVVYEPSAGVTWLADADLARTKTFGVSGIDSDGSMQEPTAASWIGAMNGKTYLGRSDWQLPTDTSTCGGFGCRRDNPLGELFYDGLGHTQGEPVVTALGASPGGFVNIQPYLYWSCAGQTPKGPCTAPSPVDGQGWSFSFGNGFLGTDLVQNDLYVMVYYPTPATPPVKPHPGCGKNGNAVTCK